MVLTIFNINTASAAFWKDAQYSGSYALNSNGLLYIPSEYFYQKNLPVSAPFENVINISAVADNGQFLAVTRNDGTVWVSGSYADKFFNQPGKTEGPFKYALSSARLAITPYVSHAYFLDQLKYKLYVIRSNGDLYAAQTLPVNGVTRVFWIRLMANVTSVKTAREGNAVLALKADGSLWTNCLPNTPCPIGNTSLGINSTWSKLADNVIDFEVHQQDVGMHGVYIVTSDGALRGLGSFTDYFPETIETGQVYYYDWRELAHNVVSIKDFANDNGKYTVFLKTDHQDLLIAGNFLNEDETNPPQNPRELTKTISNVEHVISPSKGNLGHAVVKQDGTIWVIGNFRKDGSDYFYPDWHQINPDQTPPN